MRRPWPVLLPALVLGCAVVFFVPYLVPVRPGPSPSAMAGYSNAAVLLLLPLVVAAFGVYARGMDVALPRAGAGPEEAARPAGSGTMDDRWSRALLLGTMLGLGAVAVVLSLAYRAGPPVGEVTFFGPVYENWRLGQRFYRELDFPYGPLLAYGPIVAARLTGLTLMDGYSVAWIAETVLGVWLIFETVRVLGVATTARARVLFLLLTAFFYTSMFSRGIQYTPVRFLMAPLLALWVDRLYRRGAAPLRVFGLAAVGNAVILFYSPEHGIQFFGGTLLYFVLCVRPVRGRGVYRALGLFACSFAVCMTVAGACGMLGFFLRTSGGALNLPLLLGLPTLGAVLFAFAAGVLVVSAVRRGQAGHPWVYLVALSCVTLPVALGRCDPGHMVVNLLGMFLAVFAAMSASRVRFAVVCVMFALLFRRDFMFVNEYLLPGAVRDGLREAVTEPTPLHAAARAYRAYLVRRHGPRGAEAMEALHRHTAPVQPGVPLPVGAALLAPFGATRPVPELPRDPHIFTGSYPGTTIFATYAQKEKIDAMRAHPERAVLVPEGFSGVCTWDEGTNRGLRAGLRWIFQPVYVPRLRQVPCPWTEMFGYVQAHYEPSEFASPVPGMRVYRRVEGK